MTNAHGTWGAATPRRVLTDRRPGQPAGAPDPRGDLVRRREMPEGRAAGNHGRPTSWLTDRGDLMKADAFRYDGKRAVVVGGATGMGAATAALVQDLGAEVVVMDYAPVTLQGVKVINVNLAEKASIDAAVDECGGPIHALFSCAGVADGTPGIEKINFIGHRHFIDRAIEKGYLGRGS